MFTSSEKLIKVVLYPLIAFNVSACNRCFFHDGASYQKHPAIISIFPSLFTSPIATPSETNSGSTTCFWNFTCFCAFASEGPTKSSRIHAKFSSSLIETNLRRSRSFRNFSISFAAAFSKLPFS